MMFFSHETLDLLPGVSWGVTTVGVVPTDLRSSQTLFKDNKHRWDRYHETISLDLTDCGTIPKTETIETKDGNVRRNIHLR